MSSLLSGISKLIISYFEAIWRTTTDIPAPRCHGIQELPGTAEKRANLQRLEPLLAKHLSYGLAYTTGSALGAEPPSVEVCLDAFNQLHNAGRGGLTVGARAWSKHSTRSQSPDDPKGWWGHATGSVGTINERALVLFWKITNEATWRNLHHLPHRVLVYEVRIEEGYGMRWAQDQNVDVAEGTETWPWKFRGFLEPQMENGHEVGWRHRTCSLI